MGEEGRFLDPYPRDAGSGGLAQVLFLPLDASQVILMEVVSRGDFEKA